MRSSWLALATKPRSRSAERSSRAEHLVQGPAELGELVAAGRHGQPPAAPEAGDLGGLAAHGGHRAQGRRGHPVGGERREQQRDRAAHEQHRGQRRQRLLAVLAGRADHDDHVAGGPREQAHALVEAGHGVAVDEDGATPRARALVRVEQRLAADARARIVDVPVRAR